ARTSFDLRCTANIAQIHAAPAGRRFHRPTALFHPNAAAARLQHRALQAREHDHIPASTFGLDLTLGRCHLDVAPARLQVYVAFHAADINHAAAGLRDYLAADIVEMNISATAIELDTSGNAGGIHVSAPGLDLGEAQVARHIDDKIIGALGIAPARFGHDPRCVSLDEGADLVRLKFAAGLFFGRCICL